MISSALFICSCSSIQGLCPPSCKQANKPQLWSPKDLNCPGAAKLGDEAPA